MPGLSHWFGVDSVPHEQGGGPRSRGAGGVGGVISITLDRYGHLMPGNEDEAAGLLDTCLERANTKARLAQIGETA